MYLVRGMIFSLQDKLYGQVSTCGFSIILFSFSSMLSVLIDRVELPSYPVLLHPIRR